MARGHGRSVSACFAPLGVVAALVLAGCTGGGGGTVAAKSQPKTAELPSTPVRAALMQTFASKGAAFKVSGKLGAFTRLDVEGTRSAFVATADLKAGGAPKGALKPEWQVTPPLLTVNAPTVATGDTVHIQGHASDDRLVRDVYVRVWNRNAKIPVKKLFKLNEGRPNVLDMIKNGEVQLIINTPAGKSPRADEVRIRTACVAHKLPIMTRFIQREGSTVSNVRNKNLREKH